MKRLFRNKLTRDCSMRLETQVIMEKYKDNLFSAAFNVCQNAADADDVVQDK